MSAAVRPAAVRPAVPRPAVSPEAGPAVPLADALAEEEYGGKAVALGRALRAGLPVPPGTALAAGLVAAVAAGDGPAAAVVRAAATGLGTGLGTGQGGSLAVRSSAVGEDGDGASFAGQHLTVLNVRDADAAVAAVAAVAASACAESALAYRRGHGDDSVPRCGAVLQRLVPATAAGVMFTRDPLTGADQVVVEAGWALGEAVVSGLVTPDRYRLDRTGRVLERVLGTKDLAVVPAPAGGTTTVRLDAARAARPCLRDDQLAALAELGRRCDEVFGGPSDVEWAFAGDRLSLVQRRPVTALVG